MRGQFGAVVAKEDAPLPVTELFLAGGSNSVRGYPLNSIGITLSDGTVSAGRYLATGSLEWQKPLLRDGQPSDWESAVFIDMGSVANTYKQLETRTGVGAGLRWKTPIGPLQMDLAYGVALRRFRLHLNLGFTF
jgi:translocation and assembly module TamA